jgi:ABC-type lipoprotein release transport system permease subunit
MLLFARIAWRNIHRNLRRTLITLAAIASGLAAIIVFFGFSDGFHAQWVENSVRVYNGHVMIYADNYRKNRNLNRSIRDHALMDETLSGIKSLEVYAPRIHVHGLASTAEGSKSVMIRGIDIGKEARITGLDRRIIEGGYLDHESSRGILLGYKLAKRLNAGIGDKIVLMIQASDGSMGAELFRLKGIFKLGAIDLDALLAIVTLEDAQDLAVMPGKVTELVLILDRPENVLPVTRELDRELGSRGYEVLSWDKVMPHSKEVIDLSTIFMYLVLVIILIVVALGILNTMLMSIMERTREFGIMMALGTRPLQVVGLVLLESLFLGLFGVLIGVGSGLGINWMFAVNGVDLSAWSGAMDLVATLNPVIYPQTNPGNVVLSALATFAMTLAVSVYPAVKASRLKPVEAMHFV